ncbi:MAG: xanthine dehydrogenase family protein molybdopterin-binding subunit [Chloroflexi bacterium]|nr:xanthine dehydrogenase family protein molybdopterin-binding subunit [Chloroflexota bacterium]
MSTATPEVLAALSEPEERVEARLKVRGVARYAADASQPGMLWSAILYSPLAHARITRVDATRARQLNGVHAVLTGDDLGDVLWGRRIRDWPLLARDRVRFIGDRVAVVAAETPDLARQAVQAIEVDYEELPAVFDPLEALNPDAPVLHADGESYALFGPGQRAPRAHPNVQGTQAVHKDDADIDAIFRGAPRVFEHTLTTPREHQGFIEPPGSLLWIDADEIVHVVCTNKMPFGMRDQLMTVAGVDEGRIDVDANFVGGDFGGKGQVYNELLSYFLARATGRPIKSVMTYAESLTTHNSRHWSHMTLRSAVDAEGRFLAHTMDVVFDGGAYAATKIGPGVLPGGVFQGMAPYRVPHVRMEARAVYTNTMPGGIMRSPGELQGVWAAESHVDQIARELGLDPIEFRLRNVTHDGDTDVTGARVHMPQGAAVLERLRAELAHAESTTGGPADASLRYGRGIGLGTRHVGDGRSQMRVTLLPDARVQVEVGLPDQGAGSHTVAQRVVAASLGVSAQRVSVKYASTLDGVFDSGAGGSKSTHAIGAVAMQTGAELKDRLEELAAEVMGWPADAIHLTGDRFVAGNDSAPFDEVAGRIARGAPVQVEGTHTPEPGHAEGVGDANFTAFAIDVAVDPDTGEVRVLDVLQVVDVGTIINPVAHEGQLKGGFGFGLGAALMEDLATQDGRVLTPSLGDYKLPTQMDMPPHRLVHVESVGPGPFGAKMAGELSNCAVAPAVANAVCDAVGARLTALPVTSEAVLRALGNV